MIQIDVMYDGKLSIISKYHLKRLPKQLLSFIYGYLVL